MSSEYNGWKNKATWTVALWIQNDEMLYKIAQESDNYENFANDLMIAGCKSFEGVMLNDNSLDIDALNELIRELKD